ncbi:molybdenum cofactor biosynthesis protein MoaE [Agromyces atrinae]|uniref:Molybdenum cofactor biosynthesis protein MoaE n=1 Tax=Agromyces atrinae TaxID=592376 RepID=A0A4Q2M0H6_9MICO|nr:molybdenum cofactor biosynthesis protein MoaE [Agromyces atrinae]NYD67020.1 molybdopterin synthase catalytic subunit [Agromyces atrinae]RXZ85247.1 molybdenum cofactor biosynthesis protein MoaE [Agromyces atrinae]RXZ85355.1 molybdenum cofactor biosynthesis protein MoaE [Agromyces atrinae]
MTIARVTDAPLSLDEHLRAVDDPHCGAVVSFVGQVRDHDPAVDGVVDAIEYSAHPDAERVLAGLVERFGGPDVKIAISHRVGRLGVGDYALVACVASAHRAEAFETSRALIEAVKTDLPVWKKQHDVAGGAHWVGL